MIKSLKVKNLKKNISNELTIYNTSNFPYISSKKSHKKYLVTIGIGGNIGNVKKRFDKLFLSMIKDTRFDILMTSPLLLNPPFGFFEQNFFLNGIIQFKTNLSPSELLKNTQRLENRFGRKRSFQDAPRTLDIDIVFFDNKKINTEHLIIPHKDWANRKSVTIPLKYMNKFLKGK